MKRLGTFMLASALVLLLFVSASAEQATLRYSYGHDALSKHLLEIMNTVTYNGKTYVFDFGGFSYNGAFTMLGGNVRSVQESEVPQIRMGIIDPNADLYLGTVKISPPSDMHLYVFSGDRVSGQYTLIDQKHTSSYTMDIYSTRDENGTLRLIDRVFLYSYQNGGEEKCYAASLYVSFQGYEGAAADTSPIDAALISAAPAIAQSYDANAQTHEKQPEDPEAYMSAVRILEEERTRLSGELDQKTSEAENLQSANNALTQQNSLLSEEIESLKEQLAMAQNNHMNVDALNAQIAQLEAEKALLIEDAARVAELTKQVSQLEAENALMLTKIENMPEPTEDLSATVTKLEEDITTLNAQITAKDALITQLETDNASLMAQLEAQSPEKTSASATESNVTESNQSETGSIIPPADGSQKVKPGDVIYSENGITIEYKGISRENSDSLMVEAAITNQSGFDLHMRTYSTLVNRCDVGMANGQITVYDDSVYLTKANRGWLINEDDTAEYGITTIERIDLGVIARRYLENGDLDYDTPFFDQHFTLVLDEPFIINDDERAQNETAAVSKPVAPQTPSAAMTATVKKLEADIVALTSQITAKDAQIEQLNKDLEAAQTDLANADKLTGQIAQLEEEKKQLQAEADKAAGMAEHIAQLEAENANLSAQLGSSIAELNLSTYSDESLHNLLVSVQDEIQARSPEKEASPASDFRYSSNGSEVKINSYSGSAAHVVIPETIDGLPVTRIGNSAFQSIDRLESIKLPSTLTEIGEFAFSWNNELSGILEIPPSVKKIGMEAFNSNKFSGIIINSDVKAEDNALCLPCATFLYIREGANPQLESGTFGIGFNLETAIIPASVTSLPKGLFDYCSKVTIITPAGSAAEAWAKENFIPVDTASYDAYVAQYEALYPRPAETSAYALKAKQPETAETSSAKEAEKIAELSGRITDLESDIAALNLQIAEKDKTIEQLVNSAAAEDSSENGATAEDANFIPSQYTNEELDRIDSLIHTHLSKTEEGTVLYDENGIYIEYKGLYPDIARSGLGVNILIQNNSGQKLSFSPWGETVNKAHFSWLNNMNFWLEDGTMHLTKSDRDWLMDYDDLAEWEMTTIQSIEFNINVYVSENYAHYLTIPVSLTLDDPIPFPD